MYTILLNESKTLTVTQREAIVQYSNLVDKIRFLIPSAIGENDMTEFDTVLLEYLSPVTKIYRTEFLTRSDEDYSGHLQYLLPVDTKLTAESGDVELQLTFYRLEMNEDGETERIVFKTLPCKIKIFPLSNWSNFVSNETLTALDKRISQLLALQKVITEMQGQVLNIIDDTVISTDKTYSSDKIEGDFIDNTELSDALDSYSDITYSADEPTESKSNSWFKIENNEPDQQ